MLQQNLKHQENDKTIAKNVKYITFMKKPAILILCVIAFEMAFSQPQIWAKHEIQFQSSKTYDNPIYDVKEFNVVFTAPSGRQKVVRGFWDGGTDWKVRFMPDETGIWKWKSECSDKENKGLNEQTGEFECIANIGKGTSFSKRRNSTRTGKILFVVQRRNTVLLAGLHCLEWRVKINRRRMGILSQSAERKSL